MFFFCGRGKVGVDYERLLRNEIIESCLTEQRCFVNLSCVTFCFVLLDYLLDLYAVDTEVIVRISMAFNLRLCV